MLVDLPVGLHLAARGLSGAAGLSGGILEVQRRPIDLAELDRLSLRLASHDELLKEDGKKQRRQCRLRKLWPHAIPYLSSSVLTLLVTAGLAVSSLISVTGNYNTTMEFLDAVFLSK